ncbi:MSCRAMM family protein [Arthrobacter cavernae]|uniref:Prealbumin-like fold domain-containing protein n=1 Tax=Arthrobacter cavernae TaxID=2817681 RepID=A0A939HL50_9MICC|nr:SpaA isopeptide-forming pilin-related protein [Arthrobacter cavernae]MBO1269801.1 hypothetical protein [Arthrobacter cavernae]
MKNKKLTSLAAAAACLALVLSATAAQANLAGSPFDAADGNLVLDDETKDWANVGVVCTPTPSGCGIDLPTGQTDNSFGQGSKEDTAVPSVVTGSIPNNKSDLLRFYAKLVTEANGKDYAYLAWERVQEPSGTTNMDFEFNKGNTKTANGVTPIRTAGDVLIKYDLSQGGTNPSLGYHLWVTSGNPQTVCEAANSVPCWGKVQSLSGNFEGSINAGTVVDPINPDAPRDLGARTFGEAAINLTDSGIVPAGSCETFSGAYLKSRSSDSFTAALKDFIAPVPLDFQKCGSIKIRKVTVGGDGSFGFTATGGLTPATFALGNGGVKDYGSSVQPGNYTITESTLPAGWDLTNLTCTATGTGTSATTNLAAKKVDIVLGFKGDVDCTYTNRARATLVVEKQTLPDGLATLFTFTGDVAGSIADNGTITVPNVVPGTYTSTENDPTPGFDLTSIVCDDSNSTGNVATRTATFIAAAGETVKCTFTNTKRGQIDVLKVDDDNPAVPLAGAVFTLYTDNAPVGGTRGAEDTITAFTCLTVASGTCSFTNVVPGNYWVVETTTPAGHDTAADQAAVVGAGGTVSLTFVDPRDFKIIVLVCKSADNSLYPSTVTVDGVDLTSLGTAPAGFTAAQLCGLGGAAYDDKKFGGHPANVNIPQ